MEWDQRAFAWLYRSLRRVSGRRQADEVESLLEPLTARFETLSNLLTGAKWEVVAGSGMGGVAPGRLVLPQSVAWLPDPDDQAVFYLYRVVTGVTAAELGFVARDPWSGRRRALAMLVGMPTIEEAIAERYPGAESLGVRCAAVLADRFPFDERTADARCFSIACRAIFARDRDDVSDGSAASIVARELVDAATPSHTPETLVETSADFEAGLAKLSKRRASEEYRSPWGLLMPPPTPWHAALEPPEDPQSTLPSGTERKMRRRPTDVEYVDLESQKDRDNPLVHSFEKVHTATEYQSGRKQLDGSDQLAEQEEALDELELTKLTRTSETAQSIYRADLQAGLHTADLAGEPESSRAHRYPEWNFKRREYRAAWCTVNEQVSPPSSPVAMVASASRRLHGEVLRLQAELKRLELERRWRNRQLDGTEIDIDALVDRQATLMARRHPDPRIYVRRKVHDSELAMLILVDGSLSSDSWVSGRRIFDVIRDSAQVLLESFEPTSAKLCLGAFYSNTRRDCRFLLAKGFDDSSRVGLRRLHAVAPAGYTRIGPAIRHSLEVLESSGARRRLVLLLTDAKPTDYDHYEGRYGIEDVRQALREAAERGVHCLTLAVRDQSQAYLTQMFGPHGWMLLPDVHSLPNRFVSVATDFLRS
ncbi:MAG: VWA domain-containing protein [Myxococcales bacterium]|nr:MAG: VWA domain-containing protein [Myxococcales bacterium]